MFPIPIWWICGPVFLLVGLVFAGCGSEKPTVTDIRPTGPHGKADPNRLATIVFGSRALPVVVVKKNRLREEFTCRERRSGSGTVVSPAGEVWRSPADLLYREVAPTAVLFAYPDARRRPLVLLDSLGRPLDLVFLDGAGKILKRHRITLEWRRQVLESGGAARFAVFLRPGIVGALESAAGAVVGLPRSAWVGAEPEFTAIQDPHPIEIRVAGIPVRVEIADTSEKRARGLMYRHGIPAGTGMLFTYREDDVLSFWMLNTRVALDVAYIDRDRVIRRIFRLEPQDLEGRSSEIPVRMALETAAGWFQENGIQIGDRVELPAEVLRRMGIEAGNVQEKGGSKESG